MGSCVYVRPASGLPLGAPRAVRAGRWSRTRRLRDAVDRACGRRLAEVGGSLRERRQKIAEFRVQGRDPYYRPLVVMARRDLQGAEGLRHRAMAVALEMAGQGEPQAGHAFVELAAGRLEEGGRLAEHR